MLIFKILLDEILVETKQFLSKFEPFLYDEQASCQILLKSVKNFLSYLDHRATEPQTEPQTESQTHTSKTIPRDGI